MPTYTKNYNLEKPFEEEFYDVERIWNVNSDKIDKAIKDVDDKGGKPNGFAQLGSDGYVVDEQLPPDIKNAIPKTEKGIPDGVATLDATGKLTPSQRPIIHKAQTGVLRSGGWVQDMVTGVYTQSVACSASKGDGTTDVFVDCRLGGASQIETDIGVLNGWDYIQYADDSSAGTIKFYAYGEKPYADIPVIMVVVEK